MTAAVEVDQDEIEFPSLAQASFEPNTPDGEEAPKTRKRRSDAGQPRGPRGSTGPRAPRTASTAKLETELLLPIATLAKALSFSLPTVAAVLVARGEATSKALVQYAQGHPKMLAALQSVSKVGPAGEIIETLAMILIAGSLDMQRMHPMHPIAQITGISAIFAEMHPNMGQPPPPPSDDDEDPPFGGFDNITPPPPEFDDSRYNADGTYTDPVGYSAGAGAAVRNNG
jgi:hypothetical protein